MTLNRKTMPRMAAGYRSTSSYERYQEQQHRRNRIRHTVALVIIWLTLVIVWRITDAHI
jgi:hypothetical protein